MIKYVPKTKGTDSSVAQEIVPAVDTKPIEAKPMKEEVTMTTAATGSNITFDTVKGNVTIKHPDGSETVMDIPVKTVAITKPMANLGYSAQITKNLGNYESAKISVSLFMPTDIADIDENFVFLTNWVDGKVNDVLTSING